MITADEGYFFGLGAFETVSVENGKPVFLQAHYNRLKKAADFFDLIIDQKELEERVQEALGKEEMQNGRRVLKIVLSKNNLLVQTRENTYKKADYEKGFTAAFSSVRRNETSPLTYHKTLNYGDCILEKRRAKEQGIQEPIFLNTKGEISEGATTNVFFVKDKKIIAPPLSCGMMPGIMRQYLYENYEIQEQVLHSDEIQTFDEMFVTNSLLGIMPVRQLEQVVFSSMEFGRMLLKEYSLGVGAECL